MFKWLFWNGCHQLRGTCNLRQGGELPQEQSQAMGPLAVRGSSPQLNLVVPDHVDIALLRLVERADGYLLGIQLHNAFHVRALMLRVYRERGRGESLVYQEILERADLLALAEAGNNLTTGMPPLQPDPALRDQDELATATFRFELWVHQRPDGFAPWQVCHGTVPAPTIVPGVLVGHAWRCPQRPEPRACPRGLTAKPTPPDRSARPYRLFNAAVAGERASRDALNAAALAAAPFTEALARFAKPISAPADPSPDEL